jgi:hypothetical protein
MSHNTNYEVLYYIIFPKVIFLDTGFSATSTQFFLGFPASTSECWDGSPVFKSLLHASHVAPHPDLNFLVTFLFSYLCTCKITTATLWQPNCN